jgi:glycosyltransferase involved in cell wall biosynthesis
MTEDSVNMGYMCLTYLPVPHIGFGVAQICVSILEHFPNDLISPTMVLPIAFRAIATSVNVKQAIPYPIPYRYVSPIVIPALNSYFRRTLAAANPRNTVAYFWPPPPLSLVRFARERGFVTVREMVNTCTGTAKIILDDAYGRLGLQPDHRYTNEVVKREREELELYDYIFSPNPNVDDSLVETGIDRAKLLRSTYGWLPSRFASSVGEEGRKGFRALFVGTICVRKGVPQLLAAWKKSGVAGELLLVGDVEASLKPLLAPYLERHGVRLAGFVPDVGRLLKSADIFVFPTLEEGDPLVTYEAAACGLPVITTLMGSANIIRHGVNGLVVRPHDVDGLAEAMYRLSNAPELRNQLARQAANDAMNFTYDRVGNERAKILCGLIAGRSARPNKERRDQVPSDQRWIPPR